MAKLRRICFCVSTLIDREHFRQTEKFSHSFLFFISFTIVTIFLTLPDAGQDMVVEQGVPVVVGLAAWGLHVLYDIKNWLISLPISVVILIVAVGTLVGAATRTVMTLQRREAKPTGSMLTPMQALESLSPTSTRRRSRVFVEGGESESSCNCLLRYAYEYSSVFLPCSVFLHR